MGAGPESWSLSKLGGGPGSKNGEWLGSAFGSPRHPATPRAGRHHTSTQQLRARRRSGMPRARGLRAARVLASGGWRGIFMSIASAPDQYVTPELCLCVEHGNGECVDVGLSVGALLV